MLTLIHDLSEVLSDPFMVYSLKEGREEEIGLVSKEEMQSGEKYVLV